MDAQVDALKKENQLLRNPIEIFDLPIFSGNGVKLPLFLLISI